MDGSDISAASEIRRSRGNESTSTGGLETGRGAGTRLALEVLLVVDTVAFLAASVIHFGFPIPLGFTTVSDVSLLPAAIAEGAIGVALALATAAMFSRLDWAWIGATAAHVFGILGVLVGLSVTLGDPADSSSANFLFHLSVLPVLVVGLALLLTRSGKTALGRKATPPEVNP